MKMNLKGFGSFLFIFCSALTLAVVITTLISIFGYGGGMIPIEQIGYDFILATFIACVQMIWIGSEKDSPGKRIRRSIIHFAILIGGSTILMSLFGWLPPLGWPMLVYFGSFVGMYIVIWIVIWKINVKKANEYNEKLDEYKKKANES